MVLAENSMDQKQTTSRGIMKTSEAGHTKTFSSGMRRVMSLLSIITTLTGVTSLFLLCLLVSRGILNLVISLASASPVLFYSMLSLSVMTLCTSLPLIYSFQKQNY
jgi:hypothetical protein